MRFRLRHRRALYAGACAASVLLATAAAAAPAAASAGSTLSLPVLLSGAPLGLNTAPWDYIYAANTSASGGVNVIQPLLQAASINMLRYGGGSLCRLLRLADQHQHPELPARRRDGILHLQLRVLGLAQLQPVLPAGQGDRRAELRHGELRLGYPRRGRRLGRSGQEHRRPGRRAVGGRQRDLRLLGGRQRARRPAENFAGYTPNTYTTVNGVYENPTCPQTTEGDAAGTQTLATSYAVNAKPFLIAMKAADPAAQIGVPWAFGSNVPARPCRTTPSGTTPCSAPTAGTPASWTRTTIRSTSPAALAAPTRPTSRSCSRCSEIPSLYRRDPGRTERP